jgi:hypothetical protein
MSILSNISKISNLQLIKHKFSTLVRDLNCIYNSYVFLLALLDLEGEDTPV